MKIKYILISLLLVIGISCKESPKATSPADLMVKLQTALYYKNAKAIENYLIRDSIRTPQMGKALSELIVELHHSKPWPKSFGRIKLPKASGQMVMNLLLACNFDELVYGEYNEQLEELRFENTNGGFDVEHIAEVKKTKDGFKFWPMYIENSAIIYTNELYKRLPEAVSADSITQRKNIDRLLELYVPEEDRILE